MQSHPKASEYSNEGVQAAGQPRLVHVKSAVSSVCEQSVLLGPVQRHVRSPRELVFVEALWHARLPLAAYRLDHRARVELTAIEWVQVFQAKGGKFVKETDWFRAYPDVVAQAVAKAE